MEEKKEGLLIEKGEPASYRDSGLEKKINIKREGASLPKEESVGCPKGDSGLEKKVNIKREGASLPKEETVGCPKGDSVLEKKVNIKREGASLPKEETVGCSDSGLEKKVNIKREGASLPKEETVGCRDSGLEKKVNIKREGASLPKEETVGFLEKKVNIKREGASLPKEETVGFLEKKIRHIVISGGGIAGFSFYGALRESQRQGLWNINDIKTMYGTSVGTILTTILALKYDLDIIDDFLIKRPWHNVYNFDINKLFFTFQTKGIFNKDVIKETFLPLFKGKDISIDITLKEFYDITKIELHYFTTNMNKFEETDLSYKTHPDWKVVDAIYCSSALPLLLQPSIIDNDCYTDGGFFNNYPINSCIENGADPDEILGIKRCSMAELESLNITEDSSLMDYVLNILSKVTEKVLNNKRSIVKKIKHQYIISAPIISLYKIYYAVSTQEERLRLIKVGVDEVISVEGQPLVSL